MSRPFLEQIDQNIPKTDLKDHDKAVFILHDQLNLEAWPEWVQEEKPLLIFMESNEKGNDLPHHKVKATYILSCMRHFALECHEKGFPVLYHSTPEHFDDGLSELLQGYNGELTYMTPSEWDTRERLQSLHEEMEDILNEIPNGFFIADAEEWKEKIEPGYRMEYFYRDMRRKTGYLMNDDDPEGGEWNYDDQNREKLPKDIE
ncbi:MAG: cryptochrome/photolyase family protein, partial [Balneolaceae bacterium]|nr:cryptochrome/photolyase family protein [Balneolaceae bacterium]